LGVRIGGQEAEELVLALDRARLGATRALPRRPDARKGLATRRLTSAIGSPVRSIILDLTGYGRKLILKMAAVRLNVKRIAHHRNASEARNQGTCSNYGVTKPEPENQASHIRLPRVSRRCIFIDRTKDDWNPPPLLGAQAEGQIRAPMIRRRRQYQSVFYRTVPFHNVRTLKGLILFAGKAGDV
jgi:hypothetical protein